LALQFILQQVACPGMEHIPVTLWVVNFGYPAVHFRTINYLVKQQ
jgi:hypothetical protein